MKEIYEFNYNDITIAEKYLNGLDEAYCKNALWSFYNVMKKMLDAPAFDGRQMPGYVSAFNMLYLLSKNGSFKDGKMDTLIWSGEFKLGEYVSAEKYQYIPEDYGFVYTDFIYKAGVKPKKKMDVRNLEQLSLSYEGDDYSDVIFGLKLFADICAEHSWPFFMHLDLRIVFKNATELGLPLGNSEQKRTIEALCRYYLTDEPLLAGAENLFELASKFKMRNREKSGESYTFTYRGENVMNLFTHGEFNNLEIMLNIGRGDDAAKLLTSFPEDLRAEYIDNLFRLHGDACKGCSTAILFEDSGKSHWIATCNFGYKRFNPTAEQFKLIEQILTRRITAIDEQKAAAKADKSAKTPKTKPNPLSASERAERTQMFKNPDIQESCDYFIKDELLNETLTKVIEMSHNLGLGLKLKNQKRYDARYKYHYLIKIRIEDNDDYNVSIFADCWRENAEDVKQYILALPDEVKQKYATIKQTHCRNCKTIACDLVYNIKDALVCPKWGYEFHNPKPEQVEDMKILIDVMMGYVDSKDKMKQK